MIANSSARTVPVILFVIQRRSGSHFCMHQALAGIHLAPMEYGIVLDSIQAPLIDASEGVSLSTLAGRRYNAFYTSRHRAYPAMHGSDTWRRLSKAATRALGIAGGEGREPMSPFKLAFVCASVESTTMDNGLHLFQKSVSRTPMLGGTGNPYLFTSIRAARPLALSLAKWAERWSSGKRKRTMGTVDLRVWEDHYEVWKTGRTAGGVPARAIMYSECVETRGGSARRTAGQAMGETLRFSDPPDATADVVLPYAYGSSFVGSGKARGRDAVASVSGRSHLLGEFDDLLRRSPLAREHAEQYGEL